MLEALGGGGSPLPGGGGLDPRVMLVIAHVLELYALVSDGPAAVAAGATAWVLVLLIELRER
jgi:hypothetical protein